MELLNLNILKSFKYSVHQKSTRKFSVRIFRKTNIVNKGSLAVMGGGILRIGTTWSDHPAKLTTLVINNGGRLTVTGNFSVLSGAYISIREDAELRLASGYFNTDCHIVCSKAISIGNVCEIGSHVTIRDCDDHQLLVEGYESTKPIVIGNHVWIGQNVTILKGVHVGDGAVIGAGSVVTKNIPAHCVAVGNPARVIRENVEWK